MMARFAHGHARAALDALFRQRLRRRQRPHAVHELRAGDGAGVAALHASDEVPDDVVEVRQLLLLLLPFVDVALAEVPLPGGVRLAQSGRRLLLADGDERDGVTGPLHARAGSGDLVGDGAEVVGDAHRAQQHAG